jgi:hypothetical protein
MKKKILSIAIIAAMSVTALAGCGSDTVTTDTNTTSQTSTVVDTADDSVVSDETFAQLQDLYSQLVNVYTIIADAQNGGTIELSSEAVDATNEAADIINEIGEIQQSDLSEDDAVDVIDAILAVNDILQAVADTIE